MNAHDWYVENRAAFVARSLERRDERTFVDHLVRCEECTREVAGLERDLAWLPIAVAPIMPRPGLGREFAERVLGRRKGRYGWVLYLAAAASLFLALGIGLGARTERRQLQRAVAERDAHLTALRDTLSTLRDTHLAALRDTLSILRDASRVVQTKIPMSGHDAGLLIFQEQATHRWCVIVHGLPPAPAGQVYQFWFITETGMVRSVEVQPLRARPALVAVPMPEKPMSIMGAALTVEPVANYSPEPRGVELAHVMF